MLEPTSPSPSPNHTSTGTSSFSRPVSLRSSSTRIRRPSQTLPRTPITPNLTSFPASPSFQTPSVAPRRPPRSPRRFTTAIDTSPRTTPLLEEGRDRKDSTLSLTGLEHLRSALRSFRASLRPEVESLYQTQQEVGPDHLSPLALSPRPSISSPSDQSHVVQPEDLFYRVPISRSSSVNLELPTLSSRPARDVNPDIIHQVFTVSTRETPFNKADKRRSESTSSLPNHRLMSLVGSRSTNRLFNTLILDTDSHPRQSYVSFPTKSSPTRRESRDTTGSDSRSLASGGVWTKANHRRSLSLPISGGIRATPMGISQDDHVVKSDVVDHLVGAAEVGEGILIESRKVAKNEVVTEAGIRSADSLARSFRTIAHSEILSPIPVHARAKTQSFPLHPSLPSLGITTPTLSPISPLHLPELRIIKPSLPPQFHGPPTPTTPFGLDSSPPHHDEQDPIPPMEIHPFAAVVAMMENGIPASASRRSSVQTIVAKRGSAGMLRKITPPRLNLHEPTWSERSGRDVAATSEDASQQSEEREQTPRRGFVDAGRLIARLTSRSSLRDLLSTSTPPIQSPDDPFAPPPPPHLFTSKMTLNTPSTPLTPNTATSATFLRPAPPMPIIPTHPFARFAPSFSHTPSPSASPQLPETGQMYAPANMGISQSGFSPMPGIGVGYGIPRNGSPLYPLPMGRREMGGRELVEIPRFKKKGLNLGIVRRFGIWERLSWILLWVFWIVTGLAGLFFDVNIIYMTSQCATHPSSGDGSSKGWTFATAAYGILWGISAFGVWLGWEVGFEFWRRWKLPRPAIEPIHFSYPASLYLSLVSFPHYTFLLHIRLSPLHTASAKDIVPETAHLLVQLFPSLLPQVPRAAIGIILLTAFASSSTIEAGSSARDPHFFDDTTGELTTYSRRVIYAFLAYVGIKILVVLISSIILWIFSSKPLGGIFTPSRELTRDPSVIPTTPKRRAKSSLPPPRDPSKTASPRKTWWSEENEIHWGWRERSRGRIQDAFELCMFRQTPGISGVEGSWVGFDRSTPMRSGSRDDLPPTRVPGQFSQPETSDSTFLSPNRGSSPMGGRMTTPEPAKHESMLVPKTPQREEINEDRQELLDSPGQGSSHQAEASPLALSGAEQQSTTSIPLSSRSSADEVYYTPMSHGALTPLAPVYNEGDSPSQPSYPPSSFNRMQFNKRTDVTGTTSSHVAGDPGSEDENEDDDAGVLSPANSVEAGSVSPQASLSNIRNSVIDTIRKRAGSIISKSPSIRGGRKANASPDIDLEDSSTGSQHAHESGSIIDGVVLDKRRRSATVLSRTSSVQLGSLNRARSTSVTSPSGLVRRVRSGTIASSDGSVYSKLEEWNDNQTEISHTHSTLPSRSGPGIQATLKKSEGRSVSA